MKIAVVGLGLIGGSMAKAIKRNTSHTVYGMDVKETVRRQAMLVKAIDGELTERQMGEIDLWILALYPMDTVQYLRKNAKNVKRGAIIMDCCGVKRLVCAEANRIAGEYGFVFVGAHPMAGRECSGFAHALDNLFAGASMILTPMPGAAIEVLEQLKRFCTELGFAQVKHATPQEHDRMIAYTSQLAHVLSSAYIKSPAAEKHDGFSAGSFKDMTRVAVLNEQMWAELFLENRDYLTAEIAGLVERLLAYRKAIAAGDRDGLEKLLREGSERKLHIDGRG